MPTRCSRWHTKSHWNKSQIWSSGHHRLGYLYIECLVQDCSKSSATALEILQSCIKSIEMICHMNSTHGFVTYCRVVVELFINLLLHGIYFHDDVIKWKHFSRYWPFVRGIHRSPVNSHHKRLWRGAFMFSLICAWTNVWVNNRNAGDLMTSPRYSDVTLMVNRSIPNCSKIQQLAIIVLNSRYVARVFVYVRV